MSRHLADAHMARRQEYVAAPVLAAARSARLIRENLHSIGLAESVTSIVSGVGIVWLLGGSRAVALSMAPKAVTTPIAVAVSEQIGGLPALTAALAILGGILAAVVGQHTLHCVQVRDWRAHGLAAGIAGSGVAAAQVAARNELGAAFAALGIGLNGLLTAILVPMLVRLWHQEYRKAKLCERATTT
jgi:putative effector of murein hydrolase